MNNFNTFYLYFFHIFTNILYIYRILNETMRYWHTGKEYSNRLEEAKVNLNETVFRQENMKNDL